MAKQPLSLKSFGKRGHQSSGQFVEITVDTTGLNKFINSAPDMILEEMHDEMEKALNDMIAAMRVFIPKDTGRLSKSGRIHIERNRKDLNGSITFSAVDDDTGYNYAGIQETNETFYHDPPEKAHAVRDTWEENYQTMVVDRLVDAINHGNKRACKYASQYHQKSQNAFTQAIKSAGSKAKSLISRIGGLFRRKK